jgi:hypothetical protein
MYSIDIYRTDDAILIHDKPGGWKRALPGLLMWLFGLVFIGGLAIVNILDGLLVLGILFGLFFGSLYIWLLWYTFWRIGGHATILIDRDSVRYDWWFFFVFRSRIYPRPATIKTEKNPGSLFGGGSFCAVIRFRKRWWQAEHLYLPTAAERHWLFSELARFQEEVPTTLPIDDKRPVRKGSFTESESGMNVLETLDWRGKCFQRVVPKSESVPEEKTQPGTPGVLSLRCARCHKMVPREHVLPDKPLAHCPDCGCVFEPQELKVGNRPPGGCVGDSRQEPVRSTAHCCPAVSNLPDFPNGRVHCNSCNKTFPIENAVAYKIEVIADKQPDSIAIERTDDSLTMRYVPDAEKGLRRINIVACYICLLMFTGMLAAMIGMLVHNVMVAHIGMIIFGTGFLILMGPMVVFLYFACNNDLKACYCDWTIQLDTNEARFELRCKKHRKTVVIPREKIIEAKSNDDAKNSFKKIRFGPFPEFLWCRDRIGGHFLLDDGTKHYLPLGSVDQRKVRDITNWMLAALNGFLAEHPQSGGKME